MLTLAKKLPLVNRSFFNGAGNPKLIKLPILLCNKESLIGPILISVDYGR
jgi:hypothetical protein